MYTALINPGIPLHKNGLLTDENVNFRQCKKCKLWVNTEAKSNHCFECNICVEGYDHHCPWTTKCIGKGNFYSFLIFIAFTMALFGYFVFSMSLIQH